MATGWGDIGVLAVSGYRPDALLRLIAGAAFPWSLEDYDGAPLATP